MLDIKSPPSQILIAASILSADFGAIAQDCRDVLDRGADLLHVDVMDGHFVPNLTMGADMVRGLRKHFPDVYLDVHLMVEYPAEYIDSFADAGANMFSFHLEVCSPAKLTSPSSEAEHDPDTLIGRIHDRGMDAGMVINPPTEPAGLEPFLNQLELVLVMSVHPGRSGQSFIPQVLDKVRWLKERIGPATRLEIDGGLKPDTAPAAIEAGADTIVSASGIFGAEDRTAAIKALRGQD